jgi:hypothetical protein
VVSLVFGLSTAGASQQKAEITVVKMRPAHPQPDRTFTQRFVLLLREERQHMADIDCFAMTDYRRVPLVEMENDGMVAHCTWALPEKTGPTLDGMIVVWSDAGTKYFHGFDIPIRR